MTIVILNEKDTRNTIKLIATSGKKLDERIHQAGCSAMAHYHEHGDGTLLTELAHAMPKSGRGNALKYWVTKYANVQWDKKAYAGTGGFVKNPKDAERTVHIEEAMLHPFWEKVDTEQKEWKPENALQSFINKFKSQYAEGKVTAAQLQECKEMLDAVQVTVIA